MIHHVFPAVVLGLIPILMLLDARNAFAGTRRVLEPASTPSDDFTLIVPVFGDPRYYRNEDYLVRFKRNVMLALNTSNPAMEAFADQKEREGWRVVRSQVDERQSPGGMIRLALSAVETGYAIRLDADTVSEGHPGCAVAAMRDAGADLASVKVLPSRRSTLAEKLQGVEYDIAMRSRRNQPWLTSGAFIMARTSAFAEIMERHSLYFHGEDMEVGYIAKFFGMSVRHVDFTVLTDVPSTFRALFRQRRGWWCGSFRSAIVNIDKMVRFPISWLYNSLLIWVLLAGKFASTKANPALMPILIVLYMLLTLAANWPVRSRWMLAYPLYAIGQLFLMPVFGVVRYLHVLRNTGHTARYRVGFRDRGRRRRALAAASGTATLAG